MQSLQIGVKWRDGHVRNTFDHGKLKGKNNVNDIKTQYCVNETKLERIANGDI